ncbi:hypothetical protein [Bradyrhizobium jicamae]|uniref:hypothetical protein n=1 Tax=Bradyrhizobium jicamae TaxID=280332 RepID=UPI001BAB3930|nr:hypothetical protein [Bradyrhizobium jicamae]MBR0936677.1 hypothetical protein [Bradyrhizobium jicamae]
MARIRTIKPEFWTSAQVMECSPLARLLFIGMWNFADDAGRMANSPKTLKAQVFPSDRIEPEDVAGMIGELSSNGLILTYDAAAKSFIQITGWHHQKIDKPKESKIPPPVGEQSATGSRQVASDPTQPKGILPKGPLVEVTDYAALRAWDDYARSHGKPGYPRNKRGGWCFPTKWPPGHEAEVQSLTGRRTA